MVYQEVLTKFRFLYCVDSLLTFGDRHWRKVAATFKKAESLPFAVYFYMGAYFCMGAYKRDVVAVIKMGAPYSWGAYFVWMLIIPILWYYASVCIDGDKEKLTTSRRHGTLQQWT